MRDTGKGRCIWLSAYGSNTHNIRGRQLIRRKAKNDNGIVIDRSKMKGKILYARDCDGNVTGPYASEELAIDALELNLSLHALNIMVGELAELFERWEHGEVVEWEILKYVTAPQPPDWPVIVFCKKFRKECTPTHLLDNQV